MNNRDNFQVQNALNQLRQYQNVGNSQPAYLNFVPSSAASQASALTSEQLEFEAEFAKWENSFEQWKKTYANHSDQNAYRTYEKKFLDIRDKLLVKRKEVYKRNSTQEFEAHFEAAAAMASSIMNKFDGPSTSNQTFNIPMRNNDSRAYDRSRTPQRNLGTTQVWNRPTQSVWDRPPWQPQDSQSFYPNNRFQNHPKRPMDSKVQKRLDVNRKKNVQTTAARGQKNAGNTTKSNKTKDEEDMERITQAFDKAKTEENPKMSGAQRRRYHLLTKKPLSEQTATEKIFIEFIKHVQDKRHKFLVKKHENIRAQGDVEMAEDSQRTEPAVLATENNQGSSEIKEVAEIPQM